MRHHAWLGLAPLLLACTTITGAAEPTSGPGTAHPPADPAGPRPDPAAADDVTVFAIRQMWFGDADPGTGVSDANAWEQLGFDIDGKDTSFADGDVCTLFQGAAPDTQNDGAGGIDNSFGENILPILITVFGMNVSQRLNASIAEGRVTNLLAVKGLGTATTASPLSASLLVAAPLATTPTWSTQDVWPVDASSLANGDLSSPLLAFSQSYVTNGVFVAEPPSGSGEIALGVLGDIPLVLPIRHVQVAMTLSADGSTATNGVISGVIPTDRLVAIIPEVSVAAHLGSCAAPGNAAAAQEVEQAQDILLDGTDEPGQPCNGISVGLGFEAVRVQMGAVTQVAPLTTVCTNPDGGS